MNCGRDCWWMSPLVGVKLVGLRLGSVVLIKSGLVGAGIPQEEPLPRSCPCGGIWHLFLRGAAPAPSSPWPRPTLSEPPGDWQAPGSGTAAVQTDCSEVTAAFERPRHRPLLPQQPPFRCLLAAKGRLESQASWAQEMSRQQGWRGRPDCCLHVSFTSCDRPPACDGGTCNSFPAWEVRPACLLTRPTEAASGG